MNFWGRWAVCGAVHMVHTAKCLITCTYTHRYLAIWSDLGTGLVNSRSRRGMRMRGIDLLKKGPAKISRKRHRTQNMQVLPSPSHKLHVLVGTCLQFSAGYDSKQINCTTNSEEQWRQQHGIAAIFNRADGLFGWGQTLFAQNYPFLLGAELKLAERLCGRGRNRQSDQTHGSSRTWGYHVSIGPFQNNKGYGSLQTRLALAQVLESLTGLARA